MGQSITVRLSKELADWLELMAAKTGIADARGMNPLVCPLDA
jgi:hypothetical protein